MKKFLVIAITAISATSASMIYASAASADETHARCVRGAEDQALTQDQAEKLCGPAGSATPAQCYARSKDLHGLSPSVALSFCSCLNASSPQNCATNVLGDAHLSQNQKQDICKDPALNRIWNGQCFSNELPMTGA